MTDPPLKITIPSPPAPVVIGRQFAKGEKAASTRPNLARGDASDSLLVESVISSLSTLGSGRSDRTPLASTLGRKESTKRSASKQPMRRNSQAGYEGGVERHGQANDFVDEEDDDSDDATTPPVPSSQSAAQHLHQHQQHSGPASSITSPVSTTNIKLPDLSSTQRNRNPSSSSHHHPGRLPLHSRHSSHHSTHSTNGFRSQQSRRHQTSSITSTRSAEATQHPFPTPGTKKGPGGGLFDEWQSVEEKRLEEDEKKEKHWRRWGPYVSERQWVS